MDRPFSIYLVTNIVTGKVYVGKTGNTVHDRWTDHKSNARRGAEGYLYRSMRKHGEINFQVQTIATVPTETEANNLERIWILLLESHRESFGYNLTLGGDGVRMNEATKIKISRTRTGVSFHTPESKAKISAAHKGKKLSPERAKAIGDRFRGVPLTEEHKQKLSEAKQGVYVGEKHPMFGKKHTSESISKMSFSKTGVPSWNKGRSWTEEERDSISLGQKKRFEDKSQREIISSSVKKLWEDPAYRAKMKISQDRRYAREKEEREANVA